MQPFPPRTRAERLVEAEDSAREWHLVPYTQGILSKIGARCAKYSCSGYFGRRKRGIRGHSRRLEPPKPRKTPVRSQYSTTSIALTHRLPTPNRNILHIRTEKNDNIPQKPQERNSKATYQNTLPELRHAAKPGTPQDRNARLVATARRNGAQKIRGVDCTSDPKAQSPIQLQPLPDWKQFSCKRD